MKANARRQPQRGHDPGASRQRLQQLYDIYSTDPRYQKRWRSDSPASQFMSQRKWALIRDVLRRERLDQKPLRILDLGVGSGSDAARFLNLTVFKPSGGLVGLELRHRNASEARKAYPWMTIVTGDAGVLPFPDSRFDLVYQSTMLSSVNESGDRGDIFREVDRVLAPGGVFLSYDTRYPNPWNRNTRPLSVRDVRRALPGWTVAAWSLTAIPQLQRALAPLSLLACRILEGIPPLRSHLLILARKRAT